MHHLNKVLEEHANNCHHGQAAVGKLCWQLLSLLLGIGRSQHFEAIVTRGASLVVVEASAELDKAEVRSNLSPSCHWNFGNRCESVWDVSELQTSRWRQEARPRGINVSCNESCNVSYIPFYTFLQFWLGVSFRLQNCLLHLSTSISFCICMLSSGQLASDLWGDISLVWRMNSQIQLRSAPMTQKLLVSRSKPWYSEHRTETQHLSSKCPNATIKRSSWCHNNIQQFIP